MKKGFTLIELLVVIAILAVLATAVVLVLNPAQLVKQGRDSTRISDLAAIHSALALYLSDVASPALVFGDAASTSSCTSAVVPLGFGTPAVNVTTGVAGAGWVPVNFGAISSGSPLSRLPLDPVNDGNFGYCYRATTTGLFYELDTRMESTKYGTTTGTNVQINTKDGGNDNSFYEIGNGGL